MCALFNKESYRSGHNEAVLKTVWAYAHVGSNPTLSAKKCSHRQVGTFFADKQDSNPKVRIKQESLTPALFLPLRRKRFAGRSAQFLPAPCFRRSLFRFADDAADSLRQSPRINSETGLAKRAAVRSETGKQILRCGLRRITIPKTIREHAWRLSQ